MPLINCEINRIFTFKRTIIWNKYDPKGSTERQEQYLDFLIDPSFQGVNRIFILLFENEDEDDRKVQQQATIFFIIEEAKEIILDFSQGTVKIL